MSEKSRKDQMSKVPQLKVKGKLKSKKYSKSHGFSMKQGKWANSK